MISDVGRGGGEEREGEGRGRRGRERRGREREGREREETVKMIPGDTCALIAVKRLSLDVNSLSPLHIASYALRIRVSVTEL